MMALESHSVYSPVSYSAPAKHLGSKTTAAVELAAPCCGPSTQPAQQRSAHKLLQLRSWNNHRIVAYQRRRQIVAAEAHTAAAAAVVTGCMEFAVGEYCTVPLFEGTQFD